MEAVGLILAGLILIALSFYLVLRKQHDCYGCGQPMHITEDSGRDSKGTWDCWVCPFCGKAQIFYR